MNMSRVIGPVLAGALLAGAGSAAVFALNAVLAQRLLRRVCPHCAQPMEATQAAHTPGLAEAIGLLGQAPRLLSSRGCEQCRGTGYAGRFALGELLLLTPALKALVAARAPQVQIQGEAERHGWRSLRSLALEAALQGHTTLEEVDRVAV